MASSLDVYSEDDKNNLSLKSGNDSWLDDKEIKLNKVVPHESPDEIISSNDEKASEKSRDEEVDDMKIKLELNAKIVLNEDIIEYAMNQCLNDAIE
jgi:hypothetical protein